MAPRRMVKRKLNKRRNIPSRSRRIRSLCLRQIFPRGQAADSKGMRAAHSTAAAPEVGQAVLLEEDLLGPKEEDGRILKSNQLQLFVKRTKWYDRTSVTATSVRYGYMHRSSVAPTIGRPWLGDHPSIQ